jgi:hypothetical protein
MLAAKRPPAADTRLPATSRLRLRETLWSPIVTPAAAGADTVPLTRGQRAMIGGCPGPASRIGWASGNAVAAAAVVAPVTTAAAA